MATSGNPVTTNVSKPETTSSVPETTPEIEADYAPDMAFGLNFQPTSFTEANVTTKLRAIEKENFHLRGRLDEKEIRERRLVRKFGPNSSISHVETNRTKAMSTPNLQELVFQEKTTQRPSLESCQKISRNRAIMPNFDKNVCENLEVSKTSDLGDSIVEKQSTTFSNLTKEIGNLQDHLKKSGELNDQYRLQATIMRSKIAELEESNNEKDVELFTRNLELSECRALNLELKQKLQKLSEEIVELRSNEGVKRSLEGVEIENPENPSVDSSVQKSTRVESGEGLYGKENFTTERSFKVEVESDAEYMAAPAPLPIIEGVSPIKPPSSATALGTRRAC